MMVGEERKKIRRVFTSLFLHLKMIKTTFGPLYRTLTYPHLQKASPFLFSCLQLYFVSLVKTRDNKVVHDGGASTINQEKTSRAETNHAAADSLPSRPFVGTYSRKQEQTIPDYNTLPGEV